MKYAYWLASMENITLAKKRLLWKNKILAEELYHTPYSKLKAIEGLSEEDAKIIHRSRKVWDLEKEWFTLIEKGIGFVSLEDAHFPQKVKHIPDPPYALYYIGKLPEENQKSVAIVGSRTRSAYGNEFTRIFAKALSDHGVQVISGMARGIDADAHKGALDGSGDTFAILGSGIDVCYPKQHQYLYEKIIERGGVISEYPSGVSAKPYQFPARNRIISGFCDCVVVIEAREKSGSLITADFAIEQGRDVYALPGRVTDPLSQGCNQLIKQGAGIVKSVEDFLSDLDILTENTYTQMEFRKNILEKEERLVYSLTDFRPIGLSVLMDKTGYSITKLLGIIEHLEKMGLIKETFTNYYVRTILN